MTKVPRNRGLDRYRSKNPDDFVDRYRSKIRTISWTDIGRRSGRFPGPISRRSGRCPGPIPSKNPDDFVDRLVEDPDDFVDDIGRDLDVVDRYRSKIRTISGTDIGRRSGRFRGSISVEDPDDFLDRYRSKIPDDFADRYRSKIRFS